MADPSPEAIAECDECILDELYEVMELIESYARSAVLALRRGDREEVRLRLRVQLRDCFRHAVATHNLLSPPTPDEKAREGEFSLLRKKPAPDGAADDIEARARQ